MAKIEKAELDHIAELSKLSFTHEEGEKMAEQMGHVTSISTSQLNMTTN